MPSSSNSSDMAEMVRPFASFFRIMATIFDSPLASPISIPSSTSICPSSVINIISFTLPKSFLLKNLSANVYITACIFSSSVFVTAFGADWRKCRLFTILSPIVRRPDIRGLKSNGTKSSFSRGTPCFSFASRRANSRSEFRPFRRTAFIR